MNIKSVVIALLMLLLLNTQSAYATLVDRDTNPLSHTGDPYSSGSGGSYPSNPAVDLFYDSATPNAEVNAFTSPKHQFKGFDFKKVRAGSLSAKWSYKILMNFYIDKLPAIHMVDEHGFTVASIQHLPELTAPEMKALMDFYKPRFSNGIYFLSYSTKLSNDLGDLEPLAKQLTDAMLVDIANTVGAQDYMVIVCANKNDSQAAEALTTVSKAVQKKDLSKRPGILFVDSSWRLHAKAVAFFHNCVSTLRKGSVDFGTHSGFFLMDRYGRMFTPLVDQEITDENLHALLKATDTKPAPLPRAGSAN